MSADWQYSLAAGGTLRPGTVGDYRGVAWLLSMSRWRYQGHMRQPVLGMLAQAPSFVWRRGSRLQGAALCSLFRYPVAMLQAAAVRSRRDVDVLSGKAMDGIEAWLDEAGMRWFGVAGPPEWLCAGLMARGYFLKQKVVPLSKRGFEVPVGNQRTIVRDAQVADLAGILGVDRSAFEPFWCVNDHILEEFLASSGCFLVAEEEAHIVGYISVDAWQDSAHVNRVAVAPSWQGRGIGTRLMHDALAQVANPARQCVRLNTQTDNEQSLRLYQSLGFEPVGAAEEYWAKRIGPATES